MASALGLPCAPYGAAPDRFARRHEGQYGPVKRYSL